MVQRVGTGRTSAGVWLPPGSTVADLVAALAAGGQSGRGDAGGLLAPRPIPSARPELRATPAPRATPVSTAIPGARQPEPPLAVRPLRRSRPKHRAKLVSGPTPVAVRSEDEFRVEGLLAGPAHDRELAAREPPPSAEEDRFVRPTIAPRAADPELPRPTIRDELAILGLSRRSRSRVGSRLFTLFFVLVFSLIIIQAVFALLVP